VARRKIEDRNIRILTKGTSSYSVTLPIELIRELAWRGGQKLELHFNKRNSEIIIRDWKKE
jgi:hypothetical protein